MKKIDHQMDEFTLAAARKGDMGAWRRVFECYENRMFRLAMTMVKQPSTAEDVVQDSFIQAMNNIAQFRGESSLWGWIRQITVNQCLSYLRKNKRWQSMEPDSEDDYVEEQPFFAGEKRDEMATEMDVRKLMSRLGEQAQHVTYLYVVEGMSHKEIAALFQQTESFSKTLVSRSLTKLKQWMKIDE